MVNVIEKKNFVAEEVLEVRYTPRATFLTHIGELADYVRDRELFPYWEIDTNTISFRDAEKQPKNLHAFLSYRNAGIVAQDAPTRNFFRDKASQYWKVIETNKYFPVPKVLRIGQRNRCFVTSELDFPAVEAKAFAYFYKTNVLDVMKGRHVDHQLVIEMEDREHHLKLTVGPVKKQEARRLFKFESPHFESCGLYIDLDVSTEKIGSDSKAVEQFIKSACDSNWDRIERLVAAAGV